MVHHEWCRCARSVRVWNPERSARDRTGSPIAGLPSFFPRIRHVIFVCGTLYAPLRTFLESFSEDLVGLRLLVGFVTVPFAVRLVSATSSKWTIPLDEQKANMYHARMDEGRKRVLLIAASILVARHLRNPEDLHEYRSSPIACAAMMPGQIYSIGFVGIGNRLYLLGKWARVRDFPARVCRLYLQAAGDSVDRTPPCQIHHITERRTRNKLLLA